MALLSSDSIEDINHISEFLAHEQIESLLTCNPVDVLVLCVSAILPIADKVFEALASRPKLTKVFVLCGGIGHSTQLLYDAISKSPDYHSLADEVQGKPEASVLYTVMQKFHRNILDNTSSPKILIESKSTNCGANATETRKLLEANSIPTPRSMIIVQDPTMSLRTLASFQQAFSDLQTPPQLFACPVIVPRVEVLGSEMVFNIPDIPSDQLWSRQRFLDLIMGEYARLKDDENGYGPRGKGYISHVDMPSAVEDAWLRLGKLIQSQR